MAGGSRAWVDGGAFGLGPLEVCNTILPPTAPNTYIARTCQQDTMASRGSDGDVLTGVLLEKVPPSLAGALPHHGGADAQHRRGESELPSWQVNVDVWCTCTCSITITSRCE